MPLQSFLTPSFCIYGAGIIATSIYTAIKTLYHKTPLFFLVSDTVEGQADENPTEIDGIAVKRLSVWEDELLEQQRKQIHINHEMLPDSYLVATPIVHQESIRVSLHSIGIKDEDILLLTNELENGIMEAYYRSLGNCNTISGILSEEPGQKEPGASDLQDRQSVSYKLTNKTAVCGHELQVFQAKCHVDKPLHNSEKTPRYIVPIQVGSVFTEERIALIRDDQGENISEKNRNYCELTAAYYAWKHSTADYKGLCHYRRIFDISGEQMQNLLEEDQKWDVILPYPTIHYPDISVQHLRYISENDWQAMLQALWEEAPEYLKAYETAVASGEQYFLNYNMLIARAEIFDDYCDFLFRVLARTEELTTPKGWERADRFAGYMGENLTTIYFLKNRDRFKIAYSGKLWII